MAKMVPIAAAADHYDVSRQTVRRWISSGKITAYRVAPRSIRVDLEGVRPPRFEAVTVAVRGSLGRRSSLENRIRAWSA